MSYQKHWQQQQDVIKMKKLREACRMTEWGGSAGSSSAAAAELSDPSWPVRSDESLPISSSHRTLQDAVGQDTATTS